MESEAQADRDRQKDQAEFDAALEAKYSGRFAEAARRLRPLADAGFVLPQVHWAELVVFGWNRFSTREEMDAWCESVTDEEAAESMQRERGNIQQALIWLQTASDRGISVGSHLLATAYFLGHGELDAKARRLEMDRLFEKAQMQGFPCGNETSGNQDGDAAGADRGDSEHATNAASDAQPEPSAKSRPKRRWFQYSLSTLLLLTLLCGVVLALGVVCSRVERQRKAVAAIEVMDAGTVRYEESDTAVDGAAGVGHLRRWLPRDYFDNIDQVTIFAEANQDWRVLSDLRSVRSIWITGGDAPWNVLEAVGGVRGLKEVLLDETTVTDEGIWHLRNATGLRTLRLDGCRITDKSFGYLKNLRRLEDLFAERTAVTDAGLAELAGLSRLKQLNIGATRVTGAGIASLSNLKELEMLDLSDTRITDTDVRCFREFPALRRLRLSETDITDAAIADLSKLAQLEALGVDGTQLTRDGVKRLRKALPTCDVEGNWWWNDPTSGYLVP